MKIYFSLHNKCLRYWLLRDAPDYVAYWDAHGGDPLRKTQSDKP